MNVATFASANESLSFDTNERMNFFCRSPIKVIKDEIRYPGSGSLPVPGVDPRRGGQTRGAARTGLGDPAEPGGRLQHAGRVLRGMGSPSECKKHH